MDIIKDNLNDFFTMDDFTCEAGLFGSSDYVKYGAYNEFGTEKIPSRPFIARADDDLDDVLSDYAESLHNGKKIKAKQTKIAKKMANNIKTAIDYSDYPRNAPSTIAKKGFDHPLVETGKMYSKIKGRVKK